VPLVEVRRSRASRTRCSALRRRVTAALSEAASRSAPGDMEMLMDKVTPVFQHANLP
jgi:hypothetical protein